MSKHQLAFPVRPPRLSSFTFSEMHPDRYHVIRLDIDDPDDEPWMVWRGRHEIEGFPTHAEAFEYALRAAWGVEVISK